MGAPTSKEMRMDPHQMAAILTACLEQGFVPPLYVCAVSVNGAVLATRFAYTADGERKEATFLAEHAPAPGFILPVNIMVTDTRGEAARVVLQHEGWTFADRN
jgi:hypothetical protein